jgi:hypothetical protein
MKSKKTGNGGNSCLDETVIKQGRTSTKKFTKVYAILFFNTYFTFNETLKKLRFTFLNILQMPRLCRWG